MCYLNQEGREVRTFKGMKFKLARYACGSRSEQQPSHVHWMLAGREGGGPGEIAGVCVIRHFV
jgi:hypothetical protein